MNYIINSDIWELLHTSPQKMEMEQGEDTDMEKEMDLELKMDLRNLQFLFKPSYWLMNYEYNKEVDKIINDLLDKYELTGPCKYGYICMLGEAKIWVGNIPYAFGRLYETELCNYRPSRLTIQRLLKRYYKLKKQNMNENMDEKVNKIRSEFNI